MCRESYLGYRAKEICREICQLGFTSGLVYLLFNLSLWRRRYLYTAPRLTPWVLGNVIIGQTLRERYSLHSTPISSVCLLNKRKPSRRSSWSVPPLLLHVFSFVFFFPFRTISPFPSMATYTPFLTSTLLPTSRVIFTNTSVPPLQFSSETEPGYASFLSRYERSFLSAHRSAQQIDSPLGFSSIENRRKFIKFSD